MSFYATLPSNSSFEYYPENTLNNYTTKLHSTLRLEGNYEVGLVEMSYPQNWIYKKDGVITFKIDKKIDTFKVKFQNYDTFKSIAEDVEKFCKEKNIPCSFSYNNIEQKMKIDVKSPPYIDFSEGLNEELGFKHTNFHLSPGGFTPKSFVSRQLENKLKCISALFIYCNIIDYQFIGNTFAPLLRTILVNENSDNYGKYIDHIFSKPHYIPVSVNTIDTIEINIRDDTGEPIHFEAGKILVKLHFKPKHYG